VGRGASQRCPLRLDRSAHTSRLTEHGPRRTGQGVPVTAHGSRLTAHDVWSTKRIAALVLRFIISGVAIWVASHLISGITPLADLKPILLVTLIFAAVNALIKPLFAVITCPLELLTLGLFTFVINAAMLGLTSWIAEQLSIPFRVDGFIAAFLGALVVSAVSWVLSSLV
jgi:putative membrane protein